MHFVESKISLGLSCRKGLSLVPFLSHKMQSTLSPTFSWKPVLIKMTMMMMMMMMIIIIIIFLFHAMQAHMVCRGIAPLILNFGTRSM